VYLLKVKDVCERLNVSKAMAYRLIGDEIPAIRMGATIRVDDESLESYIRQRENDSRTMIMKKGEQNGGI
jgi:excisionase family DNA binding protein